MPIQGRVAIITGGARGIGRATAEKLLASGATVAICDVNADAALVTADALGSRAYGYGADVSDGDAMARFFDDVERDVGTIDIVINNAGIMPVGAFEAQPTSTVDAQLDVNVRGVLNGCRLALERMRPRGAGHIVNVSSATGKTAYAGIAVYAGTKHFIVGFSEGLRGELRGSGVELSLVMPGFVSTDLTNGLRNTRGAVSITPDTVAEAIAGALERPRFEVFVPRSVGPMVRAFSLMPRGARERIARAIGAEELGMKRDAVARAAYDASFARHGDS